MVIKNSNQNNNNLTLGNIEGLNGHVKMFARFPRSNSIDEFTIIYLVSFLGVRKQVRLCTPGLMYPHEDNIDYCLETYT